MTVPVREFVFIAIALLFSQITSAGSCVDMLVYHSVNDTETIYMQASIADEIVRPFSVQDMIAIPVWSPTGEAFAFAQNNEDNSFTLMVAEDETSVEQIATGHGTNPQIRWSPDGTRLAFESQGSIYVYEREGTEHFRIGQDDRIYRLGGWSPDGELLALIIEGISGRTLTITDTNNGEVREILPVLSGVYDYFVEWSPDSNYVLFSSNRLSADLTLHKIDVTDQNFEIYIDTFVRSISWNPEASHFVYALSEAGVQTLYIRDWDTSLDTTLLENEVLWHENYTTPVWSPSGSYIAFETFENIHEKYKIVIVDVDTNTAFRITASAGNNISPVWINCKVS